MKKSAIWMSCLLAIAGCSAETDPGVLNIEPEMVEETVEAGGTVSTDPEGEGVDRDDPVATSITVPGGGTVTIAEEDVTETPPEGIQFIGQQINIEAPPGTVEEPLIITFELHESLVPDGETAETMQIFRNGELAFTCSGPEGQAEPDPCVSDRTAESDQIRFIVLTSRASAWNWGVAEAGATIVPGQIKTDGDAWPPTVTIDEQGGTASFTVEFSPVVPLQAAGVDPGPVIGRAVELTVMGQVASATTGANAILGTLVVGTPDDAGEYTFNLSDARDEATVTFFNESPVDGATLKVGRSYDVTLAINDNIYVKEMNTMMFEVTPE